MKDINPHRNRPEEKLRIDDLLKIVPRGKKNVLDIGARDGYIAELLSKYFDEVVALDLEMPRFNIPGVSNVEGDVTKLDFPDDYFDVVFCAEVLEHIPQHMLSAACNELQRVAKDFIVVGVPYRQDIRADKTTCQVCGTINPPWGHVNSFDKDKLLKLFSSVTCVSTSFVGDIVDQTNSISSWLMNLAGNPWGSYEQEEVCVSCGRKLVRPAAGGLFRMIMSKMAVILTRVQRKYSSPHPIWIHMVFSKLS